MRTLLHDFRFAARTLVRGRAVTALALVTLALGIGANTAIFSAVNGVLLRPLPYREPERLAMLSTVMQPQGARIRSSLPDFADWRAQNRGFTDMAAFTGTGFTLTGGCRGARAVPAEGGPAGSCAPEFFLGLLVTPNLFDVLGVRPMLGRAFLPGEDQAGRAHVVVLSHALWRRAFAADPGVVGAPVTLNGKSYTVIGVMPPRVHFPAERYELWTPIDPDMEASWRLRSNHYLQVVGRLRPGVSVARAQAGMEAVAQRLALQYPETNANYGAAVMPMRDALLGGVRPALLVLLGAVGLLLLIACANVANLLLARAATRRREMAIRTALGASRARLARQVLTESAVLALAGGAIGFVLSVWGTRLLVALAPAGVPRLAEVGVDGRVLMFALSASLLTGVLFGLAPAVAGTGVELGEALKEGGRGAAGGPRQRLRGALVVAEVALSLVLLVGAGLAGRSFVRLTSVDPGFRPEGVLTLGTVLPQSRYPDASELRAFYQRITDRVALQPWAAAVGVTTHLPLSGQNWENGIAVEGFAAPRAGDGPVAAVRGVSPGYFRAMRIPLRAGRLLTQQDGSGAPPVIVINETMARRYWPGRDPVGGRVRLGDDSDPWLTVAGVIADVRHVGLEADARPEMYLPLAQFPDWATTLAGRAMVFVVRSAADRGAIVRAVRGEIAAADPELPVTGVRPLTELLSASVSQPRFRTVLLAAFAFAAAALAAVGIYGVISYAVSQRTREIGVRVALGARPADVVLLMVRGSAALVGWGLALGLAGAFATSRIMAGLLYGISPTDPATFAGVALFIASVAMAAVYLPARRATRIDPLTALRSE